MFPCPSPPPLSPSWLLQLLLLLLLFTDPALTVGREEPVSISPPTPTNCLKCNDTVIKDEIGDSSNTSRNQSSSSVPLTNSTLQPVPTSQHVPSSNTIGSRAEDSAGTAPSPASNHQATPEMATSPHNTSTTIEPPTTNAGLTTQSLSPVSTTAAGTIPLTSATTVSTKMLPTSQPIKVTPAPSTISTEAASPPAPGSAAPPASETSKPPDPGTAAAPASETSKPPDPGTATTSPSPATGTAAAPATGTATTSPSPAPGTAATPTPLPRATTLTSTLPSSSVPTPLRSTTTPTTKATAASAVVTTDTTTPAKPVVLVTGLSGLGAAGAALTRHLVDTASLLAVLVFGLLFFLATVAVFVTQAYESYRRKDYTQVDYLINGMYTDSGV